MQYNHDDLIVLIKNKDQKAFSYLYDNYSRALFGIILSIVSDTEEAQDILQKTFFKIWDNFDSYDGSKGRLYTWMLNISRNLAIDYKRSKYSRLKIQNIEDNGSVLNTKFTDELSFDTIGLKKVVENLKSEHLVLIDLAYYKGYTQDEISKKLDIPIGTIKTRIRKALLELREQLKDKN